MTVITKTKFAKMLGVSDAYIYKIQDQLTFVKVKGKKKKQIDLMGVDTLEFLKKREMSIPNFGDDEPDEPERKKPAGRNPSGLPLAENTNAYENKRSLENTKLNEQIEKLRIENQQKRGNLIAKNLIVKVFNRIYSILQNQFKPMGINAMPKISAVYNSSNIVKAKEILKLFDLENDNGKRSEILNIMNSGEQDRVNEGNQILEDSVGDILKNVQRAIKKFLESIENEHDD